MVVVVRSSCGGTAVGVTKQGHTVIIMHGGWRFESGGERGIPSSSSCAVPVP
jgi:hypothetical protein